MITLYYYYLRLFRNGRRNECVMHVGVTCTYGNTLVPNSSCRTSQNAYYAALNDIPVNSGSEFVMTNTAKTFIIYIYIYYNIFPSSKACSLHVLYGILCIIDDCQRSSSDDSFDPMRRRILSSQILQNDVHQYVFFKACSLLYNFVAKIDD